MRIALLGCGGIGVRHAAAAKALGHGLVACVGRDVERTQAFATANGGAAYTDLDVMIDAEAPELLIVALPPFAHSGEVEHAAMRGLHLLVEKPLTLTNAAAARMVSAVHQAGIVAANGFMYRFGDAVRRWRASDTGPVCLYAGTYHCNALHAAWWRDEDRSGGQIVEQVIHQVDLIRHLMGDPDTVYARRANLLHRSTAGYTGEDVSAIVFGWDDGRLATLNASNIATPGLWHKDWQLYAEQVTGRFSGWNDAILTPTIAGSEAEVVAGTIDVFQAQLADVVDAIESCRQPSVTLADGAASLRLALAARQSADERREIRLVA
ncbi:Gfo/Idh/MocA family oxidoreductase [Sphingosinicellaceae bacterium]|nr:Gfo/Idh/MocA family oxidoreductase [Sphingosinicellaceae bacterium]